PVCGVKASHIPWHYPALHGDHSNTYCGTFDMTLCRVRVRLPLLLLCLGHVQDSSPVATTTAVPWTCCRIRESRHYYYCCTLDILQDSRVPSLLQYYCCTL
ncbi:unnamed protein product, partial [Ectocarpus sp. 8 AP-2014]